MFISYCSYIPAVLLCSKNQPANIKPDDDSTGPCGPPDPSSCPGEEAAQEALLQSPSPTQQRRGGNPTLTGYHKWHTGRQKKKKWTGGVVVQHSPTSSSTDVVPLSKAPETPTCSPGTALRLPATPGVPVCPHVCVPLTRSLLCVCMCKSVCATAPGWDKSRERISPKEGQ